MNIRLNLIENYKAWHKNSVRDIKLVVRATLTESYPERDMGGRKAIAGGELYVLASIKKGLN